MTNEGKYIMNCNINAKVAIKFFLTEDGGRKSPVDLNSHQYRPHFKLSEDDELLGVEFIQGSHAPVKPGESACAIVRLLYYPEVNYNKLIEGTEFSILEGPKVVGHGRVISRYENNEVYDKSMFEGLIKIIEEGLSSSIIFEEKEKNMYVIFEENSKNDNDSFTQINFRFENSVLIIPWFYLRKPKCGIGSKIVEWFIAFCLEKGILKVEIRGVGQDKEGMKYLLNKFDFYLIKDGEFMDYQRNIY